MRTFLFFVLAALNTPISSFAEMLGSGPSRSASSPPSERQPTPEQIIAELKCSVVFSLDSPEKTMPRVDEFGRQFGEIWATLAERGFPYPSANDRAQFYAQILYESKNLQWLSEIDPSKSRIIDANRWRGRGPLQLSHCKNYAAFAWFLENYHTGKRGRELLREPRDLHTHQCPPPSVKDSIVMTEPELSVGNAVFGGPRISALSAVWWWQDRKVRSSEFRRRIEEDTEDSVKYVTSRVKGSSATHEKRHDKFVVVRQCIRNMQRNFR